MKSKKGFTLIELLIVIAIIAVLAVAFLPQVLGAPSKGRDAQRLAQMQKLQQFLTAESVSGATLPKDSACLKSDGTDDASKLIVANLSDFGGVFPKDPQDGSNTATGAPEECTGYGYVKFSDKKAGFSAAVYVAMENVENANIKCADVNEAASAVVTLKPGNSGANPANDEVGCYVALIQ
ncbi:type II secretion system protein [Candidatus Peregrinibacteria bacterium]|nr:type II secretion system protein [Candidatus Peregrinibacteria bacterium]